MDTGNDGAYPAGDITPVERGVPGCLWAVIGALAAGALLLAAVLVLGDGLLGRSDSEPSPRPAAEETVDRTGPSVLKQLEDIEEFHAATGYFETVVDIEKDTKHLPQWISGERVLYVGKGEVNALVDFSGIDSRDVEVSEDRRTVEITLPEPTLDKPNLNLDTSYVVEHDRGLANKFEGSALEAEAQRTAVKQMTKAASRGGDGQLTQRAEQNTTSMLKSLFGAAGFETVTVTYEDE
ncbi:DUF4230 domain-containing protein [Kytococcus schroeteri]|uniref:DUF4230 domain-containing protein n=1 Tax=Kytococcus schroeteri TaxID=138300 RepID=UPI001143959E|nr:DUF4230 domain-containing protein [Kytococcus schroeteri]